MNHTEACLRRQAEYAAAIAAFNAKYPSHCTVCGGKGYKVVRYDPSAAGVSLAPGFMVDCEPCEKCVENDICPLCGQVLLPTGDDCPACGWSYYADDPICAPETPECACDGGYEGMFYATTPPVESVAEAIFEDLSNEEDERG